MEEKIVTRVIAKYLKKGNMARCLRDILPSAGVSKEQREDIATLIHDIVRWKRLYEHIIDIHGLPQVAETYLQLAQQGIQAEAATYPFEYRYSCSPYVASVLENHPEWAEFLNETPPTTLCVNFNKSTLGQVNTMLKDESFLVEQSQLPTALLTTSNAKYARVLRQHYAHVQDESSQLVSYISASFGQSIFDYCAGNGGKSLALASITMNKKNLNAYEKNESKRMILKRRCDEYGAHVHIQETPAKKQYDVVLVDAPCTGLGAARRNPEAKYIQDAGQLPEIQISILKQAVKNVTTQGILFYAVCTITPEETSQVIERFLSEEETCHVYEFTQVPYQHFLRKNAYGAFTSLPQGDLFYLALLQKH
jgi:16S rRNA (cytosine967-C5)-methyltransferase